jgi:FAD/FMN-containing dehydrogenase
MQERQLTMKELLQRRVHGSVIDASDSRYESARRALVWNELKPSRSPAMIVQASSADDVVEAVRFAGERQLRVTVRGGGHNWYGAALRSGALAIDLSQLDQVTIDRAAHRAFAQPAIRNRDLNRQLSAAGLAFPLGHCSTVALSGFLLNGGLGWNPGSWGPACFNVRAVEVVTADGKRRLATDREDADLLWAARGAGPGFCGVVTGFDLQLHPEPRAITTSLHTYPLERINEVTAWIVELNHALPRFVELVLTLGAAPPDAASAYAHTGGMACIVLATAFASTSAEAEAALASLETGPRGVTCITRVVPHATPFDALFDDLDRAFPAGHRYLADTFWINATADVLPRLAKHLASAPSSKSLALLAAPAPSPADAPPPPGAAFSIGGQWLVLFYAIWDGAAMDDANHRWFQAGVELLDAAAVGHYVGEADLASYPSRAARSFTPAHWQRLRAIRERYDPQRRFHSSFDDPF